LDTSRPLEGFFEIDPVGIFKTKLQSMIIQGYQDDLPRSPFNGLGAIRKG